MAWRQRAWLQSDDLYVDDVHGICQTRDGARTPIEETELVEWINRLEAANAALVEAATKASAEMGSQVGAAETRLFDAELQRDSAIHQLDDLLHRLLEVAHNGVKDAVAFEHWRAQPREAGTFPRAVT